MKTRGQGVSYMAWDAQIGRMRLVKPIPPKLLKVTIKKPTTKTPPITTLRELAFRPLWQSAIENILVYNEADGIKHPFAIEQLPFTQGVKTALNRIVHNFTQTRIQPEHMAFNAYIYSAVRNFTTFNILDNTYVMLDGRLPGDRQTPPSMNRQSFFKSFGAIKFDVLSPRHSSRYSITLASGLFFVHTPEEIRSEVCRTSINGVLSLYQILLLFTIQDVIEISNVKDVYCNYVGIRSNPSDLIQRWTYIMHELTVPS